MNSGGVAANVFGHFWDDAMRWRGVDLGKDERVSFQVSVNGMSDEFTIDAWWVKGYGSPPPHRHVKRTIGEIEVRAKSALCDTLYQVAREMVLGLFPILPRNGKWRKFSRRPHGSEVHRRQRV